MIVIARTAVKRLVEKGEVDVWTPRSLPEPAMNIQHVVRTSGRGETFTHAKARWIRRQVLQSLGHMDAIAAGFGSQDEFFTWWRRRYGTGPLLAEPIRCWVTTYGRVDLEIPQFLAAGGGYTTQASRAIDAEPQDVHNTNNESRTQKVPLEVVRDQSYLSRWAEKADEDRLAKINARKAAWKASWRAKRNAA